MAHQAEPAKHILHVCRCAEIDMSNPALTGLYPRDDSAAGCRVSHIVQKGLLCFSADVLTNLQAEAIIGKLLCRPKTFRQVPLLHPPTSDLVDLPCSIQRDNARYAKVHQRLCVASHACVQINQRLASHEIGHSSGQANVEKVAFVFRNDPSSTLCCRLYGQRWPITVARTAEHGQGRGAVTHHPATRRAVGGGFAHGRVQPRRP
mmetsp:Transcript_76360/g.127220  ORF Transcript_76360/g.127220 Transcript_76360/m.127220 type:complete len:205 (+) Transcript_76360:360-974(+)